MKIMAYSIEQFPTPEQLENTAVYKKLVSAHRCLAELKGVCRRMAVLHRRLPACPKMAQRPQRPNPHRRRHRTLPKNHPRPHPHRRADAANRSGSAARVKQQFQAA